MDIDVRIGELEFMMPYLIYNFAKAHEDMILANGFAEPDWIDKPKIEMIDKGEDVVTFRLTITRHPAPGTILNPLPPND